MSFLWCGDRTEPFSYFQVESAVYRPNRRDGTIIAASGDFDFEPGIQFSVDDMAEKLVASDLSYLPVSDHRATFFVSAGISPDNLDGFRASFDVDSVSRFAASGEWMSTGGKTIAERPCSA
ncbi:hypothetical protein [Microbacterium testaceum]|uniref:hypothetical protein n=1 Tax=Microbacterium testaceum TaxID=2033 RepID=UPI00128FB14D|nr:hypothetical protein [Microbacterium testaceum]